MAFSDAFLDELAARCDIYDIVSRYVTLKKSGSNWFGLCPFHTEKTGSFFRKYGKANISLLWLWSRWQRIQLYYAN